MKKFMMKLEAEKNRGKEIQALKYVKEEGMDPYLNITVGHYNADTEHFKQFSIIQKIIITKLY